MLLNDNGSEKSPVLSFFDQEIPSSKPQERKEALLDDDNKEGVVTEIEELQLPKTQTKRERSKCSTNNTSLVLSLLFTSHPPDDMTKDTIIVPGE